MLVLHLKISEPTPPLAYPAPANAALQLDRGRSKQHPKEAAETSGRGAESHPGSADWGVIDD